MRVMALLSTSLTCLTACERYTEATSPCFGRDGDPVASRSVLTPGTVDPTAYLNPDCSFAPIGARP
jgi:hypothetical protein